MSKALKIVPVGDQAGLKTFIRVPTALYQDDPNYIVPLEMDRLDTLSRDKNPYFKHAEAQYWIAFRDDKAVGRISAQVCELVKKQIDPKLGQFGFFECEDNEETAKALFKTAAEWLKSKGKSKIQGPYNLSVNEECGLLIEGFETPPMVMMGHGLPYYGKLLKSSGFKKAKDMYAYILDILPGFPDKTNRIVAMAENNKRIEIRDMNMKNYDAELEKFFSIFNDAWSGNWGFVPFTDAEARHAAKAMKPAIRPSWVRLCSYKGEDAAFMITIPDLNSLIHDFNGKLFPFNLLKLLWRLKVKPVKRVRVPLMGVRKHLQGSMAGASMVFLLIETIRRKVVKDGGEVGELSWILEDNDAMNKILIDIGCVKYKTYRVFEKAI